MAGISIVVFLVVFVSAIFFGLIKLARVRAIDVELNKETGSARSREVVSSK